jgi:predicted dehydrogenase
MGGPMKPRRAVLVGCGGISATWLRAVAQVPGLSIVGFVDLDPARARARAQEFGWREAAIGSRLDEVLEKTRPEVVLDCTVPESRWPVAQSALRAGCHVFSEKPLADSMEHARRIVAAAREAGRIHAVMQNRRCLPNLARLRKWIASGSFGRLAQVDADFFLGAHFGGFRDGMKHVLLLDMAIHHFDMARYLAGADAEWVWCREWNPPGSWYDHDAAAVAVFGLHGDAVFSYRGSWCAEGENTSWQARWRVQGERGAAMWDGEECLRGEVVARAGGFRSELASAAPPEDFDEWRKDGHTGMINHFFRCLDEGREPETVCQENIKSLAMIFAAIRSAAEHREIAVTEVLEER